MTWSRKSNLSLNGSQYLSLGLSLSFIESKAIQIYKNRGFAWHSTHLYAYDFDMLLGFFFSFFPFFNGSKNNQKKKASLTFDFHPKNFSWASMLLFLSFSCNLVLWYDLKQTFQITLLCFLQPVNGNRNQHTWGSCVIRLTILPGYEVTKTLQSPIMI